MADKSEAEVTVNVVYGDFSNRTFPFTREELQWIMDRAESMADVFGTDSKWTRAYIDLGSCADRLDAMLARLEVSRTTNIDDSFITDSYGNFWSRICEECHQPTMQVVRPGEVRCSNCG